MAHYAQCFPQIAFYLPNLIIFSLVSHLGLNVHFPSIFFQQVALDNTIASFSETPQLPAPYDMRKSITNHKQPLMEQVGLARTLAYISVFLLCVGYSCDKKRKNTLTYTKKRNLNLISPLQILCRKDIKNLTRS